jgi:S-methylmethionine-dependent homocysteine/selenocysteine methylase
MQAKYRQNLPQLNGGIFLTDGGTETYLIYKKNLEFPHFAAFHRLADEQGYETIKQYYRDHAAVAARHGAGFVFCSITYRASRDWGELLGYSPQSLADINCKAIDMFREVAAEFDGAAGPMVLSGCIGPRGDAYKLDRVMSAAEAEDYHAEQIATFDRAGVDMVTGLTINNTDEAVGIARAAKAAGIPSVISFTVQQKGRLKTGQHLRDAIVQVDAETDSAPAYYMINCAHPNEFEPALDNGEWTDRIRGIRPNASSLEHGVLCQLGHLEEGDPAELGRQHGEIARRFPHINVWGGCCGTDHVHVDQICRNVMAVKQAA